jgi:uncharacterized protein YcbK (DUF882 family)
MNPSTGLFAMEIRLQGSLASQNCEPEYTERVELRQRASFKRLLGVALILCFIPALASAASAPNTTLYELSLYDLHTGKHLNVVYRSGDQYILSAVSELDFFLRDRRTQNVYRLDPKLFDLLHDLAAASGHPNGEIDIVCGYRSSWTNDYLRSRSGGVAQHSMHVAGRAIDIRIPGVPTKRLRDTALRLHRGGVGYYPKSQFVHVDTGRVRQWQWPRN